MAKTIQCPHGCGPMAVTVNSKNRPIAKCPKCGQVIFNLKGYKPDGDSSNPGSSTVEHPAGGPQAETQVSKKKKAGKRAARAESRSQSRTPESREGKRERASDRNDDDGGGFELDFI